MNRRECVGPRGARRILPTPCAECVAVTSCRPGECSKFWGCDSWVDASGFRPDVVADAARLLRIAEGGPAELEAPALTPYVDGPAPFVPAELEGPQGVLPMPDAGPLFAAPGVEPPPADWDDGSDAEGGR